MRVLAVDDEPIALKELELLLKEVSILEQFVSFRSPVKAIEWVKENTVDVAFLDISMKQMNGLLLAKKIKEMAPGCAIIFVTGYSEYALQAIQMHVSGYLMKPVSKDELLRELVYTREHSFVSKNTSRVRVQCFGSFEVFMDEIPMKFQYRKTKELFAYLVDRKGGCCTNGELMAVLWETETHMQKRRSYLSNLISDLLGAFEDYNCSNVIHKQRGAVAVIPDKIQCDYYDWLRGESYAVNTYRGEYMAQYSWGEVTIGGLEQQ